MMRCFRFSTVSAALCTSDILESFLRLVHLVAGRLPLWIQTGSFRLDRGVWAIIPGPVADRQSQQTKPLLILAHPAWAWLSLRTDAE